ncbi:hypothetical protein SPD48_04750 [Pseudogracilibacillus sp. SE30717A]|uniref:hypothetical protein n=1 Tax=Pseudogracilibacillus sp. SE30717A TaxID=3098293 RepID=UPI00300E033F
MALYDYNFCRGLVNGKGWERGIVQQLQEAQRVIKKNFADMDLENASVGEEMETVVNEMVSELDRLIADVQSVHFR